MACTEITCPNCYLTAKLPNKNSRKQNEFYRDHIMKCFQTMKQKVNTYENYLQKEISLAKITNLLETSLDEINNLKKRKNDTLYNIDDPSNEILELRRKVIKQNIELENSKIIIGSLRKIVRGQ